MPSYAPPINVWRIWCQLSQHHSVPAPLEQPPDVCGVLITLALKAIRLRMPGEGSCTLSTIADSWAQSYMDNSNRLRVQQVAQMELIQVLTPSCTALKDDDNKVYSDRSYGAHPVQEYILIQASRDLLGGQG